MFLGIQISNRFKYCSCLYIRSIAATPSYTTHRHTLKHQITVFARAMSFLFRVYIIILDIRYFYLLFLMMTHHRRSSSVCFYLFFYFHLCVHALLFPHPYTYIQIKCLRASERSHNFLTLERRN